MPLTAFLVVCAIVALLVAAWPSSGSWRPPPGRPEPNPPNPRGRIPGGEDDD